MKFCIKKKEQQKQGLKMAKTYSSKFNKSIRSENAGRSILEIIGVLAIVAVLSLVGLASLKTSKEKHQSNEILNDVSLAAFEVIDNMHAQIPEDGSEVNLDNLKFKIKKENETRLHYVPA